MFCRYVNHKRPLRKSMNIPFGPLRKSYQNCMAIYHQYTGSVLYNTIIVSSYMYCCLTLTLDTTKYLTRWWENNYIKTSKIQPAAILSCVKVLYANRVDGVIHSLNRNICWLFITSIQPLPSLYFWHNAIPFPIKIGFITITMYNKNRMYYYYCIHHKVVVCN